MARNQHHRIRDHMGLDIDTNITLGGAIGPWSYGDVLHTYLSQQWMALSADHLTVELKDSGITTLTTGVKGYIEVPYNGTLTAAMLFTDQAGSISVDIWRTDYTNFPPTVANSICHGNYMLISNGRKWETLDPEGLLTWDTSTDSGSVFAFNINSVTTVARATVCLTMYRA